MILYSFLLAVSLLASSSLVNAQVTTNATCLGQYSWMTNQRGQNPCLVTSYLFSVCSGNAWKVPALGNFTVYATPDSAAGTLSDCSCSSVTYTMLQACSTCQGGTVVTWQDWTFNCPVSTITDGIYPRGIPPNASVPAWAYIDPNTTGGQFSVTAAEADTNSPDSSLGSTPTSTTASASHPPVSITITETPTQTPSSKKSTPIGAIVGGVVGGIAVLAVAVFLIFWFCIRRKSGPAPVTSSPDANAKIHDASPSFPSDGNYGPWEPATATATGTTYADNRYSNVPAMTQNFKPYDPDDPSTFPTSPAPTTHTMGTAAPSANYAQQPQPFYPQHTGPYNPNPSYPNPAPTPTVNIY